MIVHVIGKAEEILEIGYDKPRFWRRERNSRNCISQSMYLKKGKELLKLHMIDNVFGSGKKIQKLHMIVHIFGEGKEIPETGCDCPCFLKGKEIPKVAYDRPLFWRRERNSIHCI